MPTVTTRPNSTVNNTGVLVGAASAHAALGDDSDASYIQLTPGDFVAVIIATPALPAGGMWKQWTGRIRARSTGASRSTSVAFGQGTVPDSGQTAFVTGSFGPISTSPIAAGGIDTPVRGLVYLDSAGDDVQVAEMYFDAVYATAPTCTVTAPTGTVTTTTKPLIQWAHTPGTDGSGQSAAEVKVFNAAQYGAAGFSPDTSSPFWSTSVTGSTSSATPDVNLVDDNYRVYVRTAQSINGVNHWSSWDFEPFTVSSSPPPAPTVAATGDDTNARTRLVVTIDGTQASMVEVQRSVDGGATWVDVRGASRILVAGNTLILYDYESPNGEPAGWRAQAIRPTVNGDIASAWSSTATATWSSPYTWLKNIRNPSLSRSIRFARMPDLDFDRQQGVHQILDETYPVVISGVLQAAAGELQLLTATLAERDAVKTLLSGSVVLVQPPASHGVGSRYWSCGKVSDRRVVRVAGVAYRHLVTPATEVAPPADTGIDGFVGLTYQDVADTYATYAALLAAVPTYGDLL